MQTLERVAALRGKAYGELALQASRLIEESRKGSLAQSYEELKKLLTGKVGIKSFFGVKPGDLDSLAMSSTLAVDLLPSVFVDKDEKAREAALEVRVSECMQRCSGSAPMCGPHARGPHP